MAAEVHVLLDAAATFRSAARRPAFSSLRLFGTPRGVSRGVTRKILDRKKRKEIREGRKGYGFFSGSVFISCSCFFSASFSCSAFFGVSSRVQGA
jgi:hypothetical protein